MFGQQIGQRLIDDPLVDRVDDHPRWNGHSCLDPGPVGDPGHETVAVEGAIPHPDRGGRTPTSGADQRSHHGESAPGAGGEKEPHENRMLRGRVEDRNQVFEQTGQLGHGILGAERQVKLAGTFLE